MRSNERRKAKKEMIAELIRLRRENFKRFETIHHRDIFDTFADTVNKSNEEKAYIICADLRFDYGMSHDEIMKLF